MKKKIMFLLALAVFSAFATAAFAHSGGTDANGCHHNWANGTGAYHCH